MSKKLISLLLALVMVLSLCACGGGTTTVKKDVFANNDSSPKTSQPVESEKAEQTEKQKEVPVMPLIEEQVILEHEGVKITAKEYTADSFWGDGIKLLVENDSDKSIGVSCNAVIVNDYMLTDFFSTTVAAGKKDNETLYLSSSDLKAAGITNVGKVEVQLYLYDSESYNTFYTGDLVEIKTSEYDNMDTTADNVGTEIYNENGVRIVGKYVNENSFWGAAVLLYVENNTGRDITVSCKDFSVNGFMVDAWLYSSIMAGKKAVDEITLMESTLEENNITSIDEIELVFTAHDSNTYSNIFESGPITFSAK